MTEYVDQDDGNGSIRGWCVRNVCICMTEGKNDLQYILSNFNYFCFYPDGYCSFSSSVDN